MPRAARFDYYGPLDVLRIVEVDKPSPGFDEVVVEVVSAGINPGEVPIREGQLHEIWPATFPSGQGSDFAGHVVGMGPGVRSIGTGAEVLGFTNDRASHADYVVVPASQVTPKPAGLDWDRAGSLFVAGTTAYAAVRAISPQPGETAVVSGAAGGVGSLAAQLATRAGTRVIGIASESNHDWLASLGIEPIAYGEGLERRLRDATPNGLDAFVDAFGAGYVDLAIALGLPPQRINTVVDFAAAEKFATKHDGSMNAANAQVLAELAQLIASGELTVAISGTYRLEQIHDAYTDLGEGHTRGKIVLRIR